MGSSSHRASLDENKINAAVSPYWRVSVINETTSTQSELAKFVATGKAQSGEVLIAEYQSAGRGRLDRSFIAPPKSSLLFSCYLENEIDLNWLPLISGIAVCNALAEIKPTKLKWPNDIFINNRKCGGILAEKIATGVIVGIGINIFQEQKELPIADATSLALNGYVGDREPILISILHELGTLIRHWPTNREDIKSAYQKLCITIGNEVVATLPSEEVVSGTAIGIGQHGELIIDDRLINVGDIRHLR